MAISKRTLLCAMLIGFAADVSFLTSATHSLIFDDLSKNKLFQCILQTQFVVAWLSSILYLGLSIKAKQIETDNDIVNQPLMV